MGDKESKHWIFKKENMRRDLDNFFEVDVEKTSISLFSRCCLLNILLRMHADVKVIKINDVIYYGEGVLLIPLLWMGWKLEVQMRHTHSWKTWLEICVADNVFGSANIN